MKHSIHCRFSSLSRLYFIYFFYGDTDRAVAHVGKIRADTDDENSMKYAIIEFCLTCKFRFLIEKSSNNNSCTYSLSDMKTWKNENWLNEYKFLSKFENLADLLLEDTRINASGSEGASQATKRMAIINECDCRFRKRCDSLIQGDDNDELVVIIFKRANVSTGVATGQQTKNIKINGCILSDTNLMTNSNDNTILYFDLVARYGYLAQLFVYEGV